MYGIVHPAEQPKAPMVVLFNIGLHYRTSHSRMFVKLARHLVAQGFQVVRFDPSRVGYSEGEIVSPRAIDTYDSVQTGLFREDSEILLDYVREKYAPSKLYLAGLCGGALTATIVAASSGKADGVIFIAGPITVTSPEAELSTLHIFEADQMLSMYSKRALNPTAWGRFLTGKSDYRDLFRSLRTKIKDKLSRPTPAASTVDPEGGEDKGGLINRVFAAALDRFLNDGKPFLFLMPELDRATYDFDRMFARDFERRQAGRKGQHQTVRIPKANHTFSSPESTRQLFETVTDWLTARSSD